MKLKVVDIQLPPARTTNGWEDRRAIRGFRNKPPKLRFKPGNIVSYAGDLYEIVYIYRRKPDTQEWIYALEIRKGLGPGDDLLSSVCEGMGAGSETPRIVYDIFHSYLDAFEFFADIASHGDRIHLPNKTMLQKAKLVSSGVVE